MNVLLNGDKRDKSVDNVNNSSANCVKNIDNNHNSLKAQEKELNHSSIASTSLNSVTETKTSLTVKSNCLSDEKKVNNLGQNFHNNNNNNNASFVKRKSLHLSKPSMISSDDNKKKLESKDLLKIKRNTNNCEISLNDNKVKSEAIIQNNSNDKNNNLNQLTESSIESTDKTVNKLSNESKNSSQSVESEEVKANHCSNDNKHEQRTQSINVQTDNCKYETIDNKTSSESLTIQRTESNASTASQNCKLIKHSSKQLTTSMCSKCRRKSVSNVRIQCKMDQYLASRIESLPQSISLSLLTPRLPLPASDLLNLKYGKYYRVEHYPNGMAKILHLYWDEIMHLTVEEKNELSQEFLKESFREETPNVAKYVISIVHNAASYLPDLLEWFALKEPHLTVKAGVLGHSGSDIETTTMQTYRDNVNIVYLFSWLDIFWLIIKPKISFMFVFLLSTLKPLFTVYFSFILPLTDLYIC